VARPELDCIGAELDLSFNDAAAGFLVAENIVEWVFRNHCVVVGIEVVTKLSGCDQDGVPQLLDLWIASLSSLRTSLMK
jgi:hypothetical protein